VKSASLLIEPTDLEGVYVVDAPTIEDPRGYFARTFDAAQFAALGLQVGFAEGSISFNRRKGTLRGLHFQQSPFGEEKLVRCERGAIWDVAVDVRKGSPTFSRWVSFELTQDNHRSVYLPVGVAHGFITLVASTEVSYQISTPYHPEMARGVRWDDPELSIGWPLQPVVLSDRDASLPLLSELTEAELAHAVRRKGGS